MLLRLGVSECLESELLTVLADDSVELILAERDKRLGVKLCATGGVGVVTPESFSADGSE